MSRVLVVGLGNEMRGDDVAGLLVARAVRELHLEGVDVEEHVDVAGLAESMARHSEVVVVDAVAADAAPGTVLELNPAEVAHRGGSSSHGAGLRQAIELCRALGTAPALRVLGIAGQSFALGAQPSPGVVRAAAAVAARIEEMLRCA